MSRQRRRTGFAYGLERLAHWFTEWAGSSAAFGLALAIVLVWGLLGPVFSYSNTWQLVINTGTTIVTFLMVFLIQRSQNKESHAMQLKLNEILASIDGASNRLIDLEDASEEELVTLHRHFRTLATMAAHDASLTKSHSVEEARSRHRTKASAGT